MSVEYRKGLTEAHRLLCDMHDRLAREHSSTPTGFFGPTRRHHEIMGATQALMATALLVFNEIKRDHERSEESR